MYNATIEIQTHANSCCSSYQLQIVRSGSKIVSEQFCFMACPERIFVNLKPNVHRTKKSIGNLNISDGFFCHSFLIIYIM